MRVPVLFSVFLSRFGGGPGSFALALWIYCFSFAVLSPDSLALLYSFRRRTIRISLSRRAHSPCQSRAAARLLHAALTALPAQPPDAFPASSIINAATSHSCASQRSVSCHYPQPSTTVSSSSSSSGTRAAALLRCLVAGPRLAQSACLHAPDLAPVSAWRGSACVCLSAHRPRRCMPPSPSHCRCRLDCTAILRAPPRLTSIPD